MVPGCSRWSSRTALAPLAYGLLGDISNLTTVFIVMGVLTLAVTPVLMPIRAPLRHLS